MKINSSILINDIETRNSVLSILDTHFPEIEVKKVLKSAHELYQSEYSDVPSQLLFFNPNILTDKIQQQITNGKYKTVFICQDDSYALTAHNLNVFYYIVKPLTSNKIRTVINKYIHNLEKIPGVFLVSEDNEYQYTVEIETNIGTQKLDINDIIYMDTSGADAKIYLKNDHLLETSDTQRIIEVMKYFTFFYKVKDSIIINTDYIKKFVIRKGHYELVLYNDQNLFLEKNNIKTLLAHLREKDKSIILD